MEQEPTTCYTCSFREKNFCTLHNIDVCYNDGSCKDYVEKNKERKK